MIAEICPATVHVVEAHDDLTAVELFPEEAEIVAKAVDKRRREFATVRGCARAALAELGIAAAPLLPGEQGAPRWPNGVVGSMTHCDNFRAAAVARTAEIRTIGIDAEPNFALPDGVLDLIALPADLAVLPIGGTVSWDRLLFCAKEAVYKAWFPLTRRFLGFDQAVVVVDTMGTFAAHLLVPGPSTAGRPLGEFTGRWVARNGLIAAAITVPAG